jgi:predicted DNA-binding transcriptional regulator AlpA
MKQDTQKNPLLRLAQVLGKIPVSKSKWWAGVSPFERPQQIRLGARCNIWLEDSIERLMGEVCR